MELLWGALQLQWPSQCSVRDRLRNRLFQHLCYTFETGPETAYSFKININEDEIDKYLDSKALGARCSLDGERRRNDYLT